MLFAGRICAQDTSTGEPPCLGDSLRSGLAEATTIMHDNACAWYRLTYV